jgi:hypothetical protein
MTTDAETEHRARVHNP